MYSTVHTPLTTYVANTDAVFLRAVKGRLERSLAWLPLGDPTSSLSAGGLSLRQAAVAAAGAARYGAYGAASATKHPAGRLPTVGPMARVRSFVDSVRFVRRGAAARCVVEHGAHHV
jgi:hypothetical protein